MKFLLFILLAAGNCLFGGGPRDIYTAGTRWKSLPNKLGNWDYSLEATGQLGSIVQNGKRLEHRAYALNFAAGHTWNGIYGEPRLGAGYDLGSGDSNPADDRNETFELLFSTNHKFYGNMDLMGLRNMHTPKIEGSFNPVKNVSVSADPSIQFRPMAERLAQIGFICK
jgi:hypothetical protein